jgi:hypothetical protein
MGAGGHTSINTTIKRQTTIRPHARRRKSSCVLDVEPLAIVVAHWRWEKVTSFHARVYLVSPYESEPGALRTTLGGATEYPRLVIVEELTRVRIRSTFPDVRHAVEGDHGEMMRGCEGGVQLYRDRGEIERMFGEGVVVEVLEYLRGDL